ncbi:MAG TPA: SDR family oxidoreductase [Pyrinomonadaceae bacterium]|nr:SDR family oxidoreductase [Pyrinomonadaceae bacterium]
MAFSETIFLTGFPGFIGERLVSRLARRDTQFFLLVQPEFTERASRAIEQISGVTGTPLENFALIEGDITSPQLGISEEDLLTIREETTSVFHLAAAYDLAVDKEIAYRVNLEGTKNVNELCRSLPNLRRYNYISTCYIAGKRLGRILEAELEHDAGFRNFYEETKYLAELEVEKLKGELPVTILRPSVVVGDSRTGETTKYDGIYYLIQYLRKAPSLLRLINVGNKNVKLNLVPVDFVVEGIAALSSDENAVGKTLALADPDPLTTAELFDVIAESLSKKKSLLTPPPAIVETSLMMSVGPPLSGLPHSAVPYFFIAQTYDTSQASDLLAVHGVRCPSFRDYAANLIDFVKKHPSL